MKINHAHTSHIQFLLTVAGIVALAGYSSAQMDRLHNDDNFKEAETSHMLYVPMKTYPQATHKYHVTSNWTLKLLGNQGLFLQPVTTLPFYTSSIITLQLTIGLDSAAGTVSITFTNTLDRTLPRVVLDGEKHERWEFDMDHPMPFDIEEILHSRLKKYLYSPNFQAQIRKYGLELSVPSIEFDKFPPVRQNRASFVEAFIPVKLANFEQRLVGIRSMDFISSSSVCTWDVADLLQQLSSPGTMAGKTFPPLRYALIQNQSVYVLPNLPGGATVHAGYIIGCDGSFCHMPTQAINFLQPDPCLTAIHQDRSIAQINTLCGQAIRCIKVAHNQKVVAKVHQIENTLYFSRLTQSLERICNDSSLNALIPFPPTTGALQIKNHCGCRYHHQEELIWTSEGALCLEELATSSAETDTLENRASNEIYQLLPSVVYPFHDYNETLLLETSISALDNRIYFNISGNVLSKEAVDQLTKKNTKSTNAHPQSDWGWYGCFYSVFKVAGGIFGIYEIITGRKTCWRRAKFSVKVIWERGLYGGFRIFWRIAVREFRRWDRRRRQQLWQALGLNFFAQQERRSG